jgi:hypothetical protein
LLYELMPDILVLALAGITMLPYND